MRTSDALSRPCLPCADGQHGGCGQGLCGCIAPHTDDDQTMRGFKRIKRMLHPDREAWTRGGWSTGPHQSDQEGTNTHAHI
jgi:hypothetical protein